MKQKLLLSLFALLTATTAWADVEINATNFPDENFRAWVLSQEYGADGVLTDDEIAGVTRIVVNIKKIQSLKGIEFFTELTWLDCVYNQLTDINVSQLTKLTHLDCSWNQLVFLDISKNTSLTELDCSGNLLTALNVSKNTAMTNMSCSENQLLELDLSKNTILNELSCDNNQLTSLDVSKNTALTRLACIGNQLTALNVSKNAALKRLVCSNNQLASLNVSGCIALESFRCSGNRLAELDVSGCIALEELICMSNQIKGEAMDALVESLPDTGLGGFMGVINHEDEQNMMTKVQVAAAKAKGWYVRYNDSNNQWRSYEGSDDPTGINDAVRLNDKGKMTNDQWYDLQGRQLPGKPARGIYIEGGKKVMK